jgi:hypothetical protein
LYTLREISVNNSGECTCVITDDLVSGEGFFFLRRNVATSGVAVNIPFFDSRRSTARFSAKRSASFSTVLFILADLPSVGLCWKNNVNKARPLLAVSSPTHIHGAFIKSLVIGVL